MPQAERLDPCARRLRMLSACNRTLIRATSEADLLGDICRSLVEVGAYQLACVSLVSGADSAQIVPVACSDCGLPGGGADEARWAALHGKDSLAAGALRTRSMQIWEGPLDETQGRGPWHDEALKGGYCSAAAVPLLAEERCLGVLDVYSDLPDALEAPELTLIGELAADLAYGIASLRTREEWQRQQERIAQLTLTLKMQSAIHSLVTRIRDRDELLQEACRVAIDVGLYHSAAVSIVEPGAPRASVRFAAGTLYGAPLPDSLVIGESAASDTSLTGRALRTREIAVSSDLSRSECVVLAREEMFAAGIRSVVALPLTVDGMPVGALTLCSKSSSPLRDDELVVLQDIATTLSFALRSQRHEVAAEYLAHFDPLTGLAKRALFCRRLDEALRRQPSAEHSLAIAALDIHHLSKINDTFGRHTGDVLLQKIAERLKHHLGDDERIGSLPGGTFSFFEPDYSASDRTISSLLDEVVFAKPFLIDGRSVRVSCCSGVARFPIDGEDSATLVQKAEAALKHAKETGEQYLRFKLEMRSEIAERLALEHKLREAIDEQQFEIHYQPQVSIANGRIETLEALLRWRDPERGLILPSRFLPVLESSGLIAVVGSWVMQHVAADCERWRRLGLGPVRLAVNVSAVQIRRRAFTDLVRELVDGWSTDPKGFGIDLELTETALLQDVDGAERRLRELRSVGIRIALDDFGTGYSSLGLLSKLPVDLLKIDRSFIRGLPHDLTSLTLTRSIIGLASAFGLVTVAEGVETAEQLRVLRQLGCDQSQGYFHCAPLPVDEVDVLLAEWNPDHGRHGP